MKFLWRTRLICPRQLIEFNVNNTCSAIIKGDKSFEDGKVIHMDNILDTKEVSFKYYTSSIKIKLYPVINT